ncbi:hypothetical protein AAF712_009277 [Marasmius tenuissimus]|uniref:Uncharacterized protein n=1 Tax=Marasmius tenuissimus TaxID=585030 RepID=A0ABR2ZRT7_9AGAR
MKSFTAVLAIAAVVVAIPIQVAEDPAAGVSSVVPSSSLPVTPPTGATPPAQGGGLPIVGGILDGVLDGLPVVGGVSGGKGGLPLRRGEEPTSGEGSEGQEGEAEEGVATVTVTVTETANPSTIVASATEVASATGTASEALPTQSGEVAVPPVESATASSTAEQAESTGTGEVEKVDAEEPESEIEARDDCL